MNRNVEAHFSELPSVEVERSIFDRSHTHKTSFNVGQLIPFYIDEVLPGDTFKVTSSKVVRLQTMLTPIMDNIYLDTYYFFVPNRLVWEHWQQFMGENDQTAWIPQVTYQVPRIASPANGFDTGTLADYLGLPVGVTWSATDPNAPSALPFRAYAKVCQDWFRSEVLTDPLNIPVGDANQTGTNGGSYISDVANGGQPFLVAKYFDLFTSCLPSPQKGPAVSLGLITQNSLAPVGTGDDIYPHDGTGPSNMQPLRFTSTSDAVIGADRNVGVKASTGAMQTGATSTALTGTGIVPANLYADISNSIGAVSVNELRLAFQLQKFYERCARGGTRYIELLKAHFGVTSPDARLQRSEYLGGNRIPINIHEVTNTAQSSVDFLGDLGAFSATSDIHMDFEKSFTEHGFVIGVMCARYDHSFSQGMEKFWQRKDPLDYYYPVFANIGEVPVEQCEICATSGNLAAKTTFGYNEAWYDYRYKPDRVSGEMRPGIPNTLASWHLADYYQQPPTLSDSWLREDKTNVDRCLAVTSTLANQLFADIYIQNIATRCMPMYSIPGLIDHH